jgi:hypothetical protein
MLNKPQEVVNTMSGWALLDWDRNIDLGEDQERVVRRVIELLVSEGFYRPNAIVCLESPNGHVLSFGLSGGMAYAEFGYADGDPPYLCVLNAEGEKEASPPVWFIWNHEPTKMDASYCVSLEKLKEIITRFVREDSLPDCVEWEEV